MRNLLIVLILPIFLYTCQQTGSDVKSSIMNVSLDSRTDSLSYSVGVTMASGLKPNADGIDFDALVQGLRDGLNDDENKLSEDVVNKCFIEFRKEMETKVREEQGRSTQENEIKGKEFLAENAKREGVVSLPSGLQYEIITEGSGRSPKATDVVKTNYRGTLIDGSEFDSSYKRGKPTEFLLNRVIKGWTEGIQLMKTGAKYKFYIPGDLAYGKRSPTPKVPANATLIFEVELLEIK